MENKGKEMKMEEVEVTYKDNKKKIKKKIKIKKNHLRCRYKIDIV